ncbi:protein dopey-1-like isoform X2 [Limulus polyphemus]|uniref:Protein dopey-1-like isoform X2 n=1 Tax=Limulus polyphemus TaxID=6850 RepID=A0ABM1B436_LIMPO|nr:protein dopey-1-like isoform X2 [Limulus polyphemus]
MESSKIAKLNSPALEEYELLGDPKYRSYVSAVDKALKNFEYTSEWADLISALGKLNKVLLSHIKYSVIPRRITISKRLAQCMHPALPGGVHLKALETYDLIFKCIKTVRLSQELFIYSAGLFPLFGNAAMNVKPALLTIYEKHFIPLGEMLRPGLNGFLTGVLPGLEEGSEYYDRTDLLLQKVSEAVESSYFYGCMWKCILSNQSVRLPAVGFITSHYNKKLSMEDQLYLIGTDIDTMVQALCASVQDSSVLVQRSTLDFLLLGFPMHNSQLVKTDMVRVVTAAITVLLRRDMSLNRRLFAWLLGTETNLAKGDQHMVNRSESVNSTDSDVYNLYFETNSKDLLLKGIRVCLHDPVSVLASPLGHSVSSDLWSYRLLISLLDRPEISTSILDDILIEVFRSLYHECSSRQGSISVESTGEKHGINKDQITSKNHKELVKTANLLFSTLEPCYLWHYLARCFQESCHRNKCADSGSYCPKRNSTAVEHVGAGPPNIQEVGCLIDFLLDVVSLETYLETPTEHLPDLLNQLGSALAEHCEALSPMEICDSLNVCSHILSKAQPLFINVPTETFHDFHVAKETSECDKLSSSSVENIDNEKDTSLVPEEQSNLGSKSWEEKPAELTLGIQESSLPNKHKLDNQISLKAKISATKLQHKSPVTQCIKKFQEFFIKFVKNRILKDSEEAVACFLKLWLSRKTSEKTRNEKLDQLLNMCLQDSRFHGVLDDGTNFLINLYDKHVENLPEAILNKNAVQLSEEAHAFLESFQSICQLLVDMSSFPTFCTSDKTLLETVVEDNDTSLPEWLQLLLVLACFLNEENFLFTSMMTALDLIALTKSMTIQTDPESLSTSSALQTSSSSGVVSVVIVPTIPKSNLQFLGEETVFYQVATAKLWHFLAASSSRLHLRTVHLLQQLHNLAPTGDICEIVMCRALVDEKEQVQIEAQKKFCVLWHLTRDLRLKSTPSSMMRAFDRCLFLLLDSLGRETGPQKSVAQGWLNHALQRGDIARILEPILLILLHPDTARVSIQHVNVHHSHKLRVTDQNTKEEGSIETKIYAISSEGGNVIYHVNDECVSPSQQNSPEKKILALTSIINMENKRGSKFITAKSLIQDLELPYCHERDASLPISLFVNPFGSLTSLTSDAMGETTGTPDLSNAKRIDASYIARKSSSFDDCEMWSAAELMESKQSDVNEIVAAIVSELVTAVVEGEKEEKTTESSASSSEYGLDDVFMDNDSQNSEKSGGTVVNEISRQQNDQEGICKSQEVTIHPLHSHLLLYCQVYDSKKTLYALSSLKAVILTNPRIALCNMATTSISSSLSYRGQHLQNLMARHRKSVLGNNFNGDQSNESATAYRSSMFVEVVVSVCLYYIRSYYPNLPQVHLTTEEIIGNRNVRLLCIEVLTLVFSELVAIVRDSGKSFAIYLNDLLLRCKVQKTLLHCLVASVVNFQTKHFSDEETFTETIVKFNELCMTEGEDSGECGFQDTFLVHILRLITTLIVLENQVSIWSTSEGSGTKADPRPSKIQLQAQMSSVKYQPGISIPSQPMFLTALLCALRQHHKAHLHTHWLSLLISSLRFAGRSLTHLVLSVVSQLCHNLEDAVKIHIITEDCIREQSASKEEFHAPPDYLVTLVESLTTLTHYCLLDTPAPISTPVNQPLLPPMPSQPYAPGINASQIISNLLHVFSTSDSQKDQSATREPGSALDPILTTRRALLSNMPRILAALTLVWQAVTESEKNSQNQPVSWWIMGSSKTVKQNILSLLSPIALHHGISFMAAVAVVWYDRRHKGTFPTRKVIPPWTQSQLLLVELVAAIKVVPMESVVQTVRQVIKQPPPTSHDKNKRAPLEVSMLQFFLTYVQNTPGSQLVESFQSLLGLWRDGLQLTSLPPVQFHLLVILHEFVQRAPLLEEKKDQKELQDIAQKLVEACSTIAAASLEQTTWLRRNLAVRPGPQQDLPVSNEENITQTTSSNSVGNLVHVATIHNTSSLTSFVGQYTVQALFVLAEFLIPVLDIVYVSEEKEKVIPLLTSIMYYVTPYLRNHSTHNAPSFRACSQLLASMSGYQYTRKAWKKDALELFMDLVFFQMDITCMGHWRAIIDHLMTHDKTTFRDFLARASMAHPGSLNLFSSKEQEYEQRSQLLKRLAFVLFCSETDQYQRYMPDIQERLAESLRLPQVPSVQAQVFLCFRVLLLRISSHHLTSLWPVIVTEMVQVFLQIEHELMTDTEEFSSHLRRLSTLDSSWVTSTSNGLNAHNNPAWLQLYLSACKLVDLAVALPADMLPQFQMYRWAFVGDSPPLSSENQCNNNIDRNGTSDFIPHIVRLARLINTRVKGYEHKTYVPGCLLLKMNTINSLNQLQPFFNALADVHVNQAKQPPVKQQNFATDQEFPTISITKSRSAPDLSETNQLGNLLEDCKPLTIVQQIECVMERDFLEPRMSS